jgi:hypothetical protein
MEIQTRNVELGVEPISAYGSWDSEDDASDHGSELVFDADEKAIEEPQGFSALPSTESWSPSLPDIYKTFIVDLWGHASRCLEQIFGFLSVITLFYLISGKRVLAIRRGIILLAIASIFLVKASISECYSDSDAHTHR